MLPVLKCYNWFLKKKTKQDHATKHKHAHATYMASSEIPEATKKRKIDTNKFIGARSHAMARVRISSGSKEARNVPTAGLYKPQPQQKIKNEKNNTIGSREMAPTLMLAEPSPKAKLNTRTVGHFKSSTKTRNNQVPAMSAAMEQPKISPNGGILSGRIQRCGFRLFDHMKRNMYIAVSKSD